MKVSSEVNGGGDILFTLNKGNNRGLKCKSGTAQPLCPLEAPVVPFLRSLEEDPFFCIEVPDCSGPNCFENLLDCLAGDWQEPLYYCVLPRSSGCDGVGVGGVDCGAVDGDGVALWPHAIPVCSGDNDCIYVAECYPNGCPAASGCGNLVGGVCLGSAGSDVTRIPLEEYDPSVHEIVSGPITGGESCFEGSSSTSDEENSSSSSVEHCPVIECGCDPAVSQCYSLDCGLNPNGTFVVDCDLCECVEVVASSSSTVAGSSSVSAESSSSASVPSSSTSVASSSGTSGDGGGDGGGGVVSYLCVRPKSSGLIGLDLPELENLVPTYSQSGLISANTGVQPANSGEMMNNATYDSSFPVYQTVAVPNPNGLYSGAVFVMADYGQVGTFKKVRVGPPPCYKNPQGYFWGAINGSNPGSGGQGECTGGWYYSASVQYSVDGSSWLSVGSTTYAPFLNEEKTLVGTELVGDESLKEARYIRVVGSVGVLALSELHAVTMGGGSGGVVSRDVFCLPVEAYDSDSYDIVSGPYVGLGSCESNCPPEVVSSSSVSASNPSSSSVAGVEPSSSTGGGSGDGGTGDGGTGDGGTGDGGTTPGTSSSTVVGSSSSISNSSVSSGDGGGTPPVASSSSSVSGSSVSSGDGGGTPTVDSSSSSVVTSSSSSSVVVESSSSSVVTSSSSSSVVVESSSSSVVTSSSSSSVVTSSSSSNLYGYLDASFVTVLGLNPDFPEYYYGEDPVNGWAATSDRLLEFRYESLPLEGLPFAANVFISGTPVASIVYPPAYEGRDFCVVSGGVFYCGVVDEAGVYL